MYAGGSGLVCLKKDGSKPTRNGINVRFPHQVKLNPTHLSNEARTLLGSVFSFLARKRESVEFFLTAFQLKCIHKSQTRKI